MAKEKVNPFAKSAKDALKDHEKKVKKNGGTAKDIKPEDDEIKGFNLRLPVWLNKKGQLHRIDTGESMNALIVRLLIAELGDRDEE